MWSRCVTQKLRARDVRSMSLRLANVEDAALDVLDVLEASMWQEEILFLIFELGRGIRNFKRGQNRRL